MSLGWWIMGWFALAGIGWGLAILAGQFFVGLLQ